MCMTDVARLGLEGCRPVGVSARTSGGNKDKDNNDDHDGNMPTLIFQEMSNQEEAKKSALKKRDSKKKPAQPKENNNRATRNVKVKGGTTEEECVAGPVVTRALAKKSDKIHLLKNLCPVLTSPLLKIFRKRIRL